MNSEISTRSYAEAPQDVIEYARQALKGFRDGGLIATGKHFPGRGHSVADAHAQLPVIDLPFAEMQKHLEPYRALIEDGIPCIMTAHTAYPSLDPSGRAATLSRRILTDILKGEMGFTGCITTDDITMGGIVEAYEVHDAVVEALNAGCDLILMRDDSPLVDEVVPQVVLDAKEGRISRERLDDAVRRTLSVKYDYGLFDKGSVRESTHAGEGISDRRVSAIAVKAAEKTVTVLKDENGILPLDKSKKMLLIEQVTPLAININQRHYHPGILWKKMYEIKDDVGCVEVSLALESEQEHKRITARLDEADIVVTTNYHWRRGDCGNEFIKKLHGIVGAEKPIVVITNNPYPLTIEPEYKTIVLSYGISEEALDLVARKLFGIA